MSRIPRLATALVASLFLLSACGGTSSSLVDSTSVGAESGAFVSVDDGSAGEGDPAGIITLSSGETFELDVRSCETQANDPNTFFNDERFDLSGTTTDGQYSFSAGNVVAVNGTFDSQQFDLTGDRDENGVNPKIDYYNYSEFGGPAPTFAVDGLRVSGEAVLSQGFSENAVFGETVTVAFEFVCG